MTWRRDRPGPLRRDRDRHPLPAAGDLARQEGAEEARGRGSENSLSRELITKIFQAIHQESINIQDKIINPKK